MSSCITGLIVWKRHQELEIGLIIWFSNNCNIKIFKPFYATGCLTIFFSPKFHQNNFTKVISDVNRSVLVNVSVVPVEHIFQYIYFKGSRGHLFHLHIQQQIVKHFLFRRSAWVFVTRAPYMHIVFVCTLITCPIYLKHHPSLSIHFSVPSFNFGYFQILTPTVEYDINTNCLIK